MGKDPDLPIATGVRDASQDSVCPSARRLIDRGSQLSEGKEAFSFAHRHFGTRVICHIVALLRYPFSTAPMHDQWRRSVRV